DVGLRHGEKVLAFHRRRLREAGRGPLGRRRVDQKLRRLRRDTAEVRRNAGDQRAKQPAVVAVALDDDRRPVLRAGAVVIRNSDDNDVAAGTHALSRVTPASASASRTWATRGYVSRTDEISSSASNTARQRSYISTGSKTNSS